MAKRSKSLQASNHGVNFEEHIDDNMLPVPADLEKYQQIPGVLDFILTVAKTEQLERHKLNQQLMTIHQSDAEIRAMDAKLRSDESKRIYRSNMYGLTLGTLLILASMAIGAFLLYNGKPWSGSLFSVPSVIALFFRVFVQRREGSQKTKRPS